MTARQLNLFSEGAGSAEHRSSCAMTPHEALAPASIDDAALIEAIPDAGIANAPELATEAGRRRLAAAVPALERLCRRFVGFGSDRTIPEQRAAVEALAMIGGLPARQAIVQIIVSHIVQGPVSSRQSRLPCTLVPICRPTSGLTSCGILTLAFALPLADASAHRLR